MIWILTALNVRLKSLFLFRFHVLNFHLFHLTVDDDNTSAPEEEEEARAVEREA